ncbi:LIM domain-containing protein [Histoplasma capsulatum var. duboisii H88]|uniref:LIM domain-containing protein n=2 Tax=Ajellomyces capsulatus TaxID=5037 RepID=F0U7N8_AJEC8|nr:LIM domain-containing protein [Histoplasma capsulatum H143]EGC41607.1 LIM domain-containing protein [Histoplasma capsulatum var. duboisii H88]QSS51960.1 LIM domain-containing protein [Histoplasma capsulatum var. duboisii H88]
MEADLPTGGLLPVIKCSNCNASVGISEMGEHICNGSSQRFTPPPDHYNYRNPFDSPPNPPGKSGRYGPPPPKIDPFAANRPFLHLGVLTPADTDDTPSLSPSPLKRSQTSPLPPTPDPANEDGSFTPFVRSHTVAGSTVRSKPRTPVEDTYSPFTPKSFETSPVRSGGDAGSDNDNSRSSIPQEPVPYEERRRPKSKQKHRREMSIDSKSMLLISAASSRYGDESLNHYSPRKLSTSGRNVLDEVPPLPAGPIKSFTPGPYDAIPSSYRFESKEDFESDRLAGERLPKEQQKARVLGSFDFGLPSQPKISRNPDSSHFRDPSNATTSSSRSFKPPVPDKDEKPNVPEKEHPKSPIREYRINEDFSVSNFARDLGLNHSTHPSISSSIRTTPSDMASGSSHSTGPSEVSSAAHSKSASDNMAWNNLSIDVEPRRQGDLAVHGMDSPTDPSFQNGYLSSAGQKTDLSQPLPVFPTQPPVDKRAVSPPARTATRTPVGRKARCRGCQQIIVGKSISSADGRLTGRWHKACFVCHTCRSPFQTADFYVLDNLPYCSQHYHELNGSLCGSCNMGIEGQYLETEEVNEHSTAGAKKKYHPGCFRCQTCQMVLRGDYFEWNGLAYCERDGRHAAAAMYPPQPPSVIMPSQQGGPSARRPLYPPRGYGYGPRPGSGPGPRYGPGGPGMRYPPHKPPHPGLNVPAQGMYNNTNNSRRYPERRTTRLMMI